MSYPEKPIAIGFYDSFRNIIAHKRCENYSLPGDEELVWMYEYPGHGDVSFALEISMQRAQDRKRNMGITLRPVAIGKEYVSCQLGECLFDLNLLVDSRKDVLLFDQQEPNSEGKASIILQSMSPLHKQYADWRTYLQQNYTIHKGDLGRAYSSFEPIFYTEYVDYDKMGDFGPSTAEMRHAAGILFPETIDLGELLQRYLNPNLTNQEILRSPFVLPH